MYFADQQARDAINTLNSEKAETEYVYTKAQMEALLNTITTGVFIVTRRWFSWSPSGYTQMYQPNQFSASDKPIAVGVAVFEAGRHVVLALEDIAGGAQHWSTEDLTGGTTFITDAHAAVMDFDGKTKTATQVATLGDKSIASRLCNEYAKSIKSSIGGNTELDETGFLAGRWWLPSEGEMQIIANHRGEIDRALEIAGGTKLTNGGYWTSTEHSAGGAWTKYLNDGHVYSDGKAAFSNYIRAVTAF